MHIYTKTDVGKVRTENQDAFCAEVLNSGEVFAVVCDGMGGANAGNIASKKAVEAIKRYVLKAYSQHLTRDGIIQLLQNAILSANIELFSMAKKDNKLKGMGTTVVAALQKGDMVYICHIGDSRAYLINGKDVLQLTKDHSVVQSLIESGEITSDEAKKHPKRNIITRALGVEENVISDSTDNELPKGSYLLLCSDGLTNYIDDKFIRKTFGKKSDTDYALELVNEANKNGGGDNITVVVISND